MYAVCLLDLYKISADIYQIFHKHLFSVPSTALSPRDSRINTIESLSFVQFKVWMEVNVECKLSILIMCSLLEMKIKIILKWF